MEEEKILLPDKMQGIEDNETLALNSENFQYTDHDIRKFLFD